MNKKNEKKCSRQETEEKKGNKGNKVIDEKYRKLIFSVNSYFYFCRATSNFKRFMFKMMKYFSINYNLSILIHTSHSFPP